MGRGASQRNIFSAAIGIRGKNDKIKSQPTLVASDKPRRQHQSALRSVSRRTFPGGGGDPHRSGISGVTLLGLYNLKLGYNPNNPNKVTLIR